MFEHVDGIRKKDRRGTLPAAAAAAVVHVCLIALLIWGVRSRVLLAVEPAGSGPALRFPEGGGGGGGGSDGEMVSYVEVAPPPTPQPEPEVETVPEEDVLIPPEPTPVPEPPKQEAPKTDVPPTPPAPTPSGSTGGTGGGTGPGSGPGEGPGTGPGSGGGSGGGDGGGIGSGQGPGTGGGSRIRPPTSDVLQIPPDKPSSVPSQEITIRVTVDVRGRVREASLVRSTGNRGYDERVRRWAMTLVWRPAVDTATNRPVEATTEVKVFI
ncbi:MAG TPA: hypothetical protein VEQ60_04420 [Longimicrobium sp.]|nr:hypothetical protein [Longimicrobium sp.]